MANCDYLDHAGRERHPNFREFFAMSQAVAVMPDQLVTTSDVQGRFEFSSVPPEVVCWFLVDHPEYGRMSFYAATTDRQLKEHDGHPVVKLPADISLKKTRTITIKVREETTLKPFPGTRVTASVQRASGPTSSGVADATGTVTLKLPPGKYRLDAAPPRDTPINSIRTFDELLVDESEPEQQVKLFFIKPGCVLILKAVDADTGAGIPQVQFNYEKNDGSTWGVQSNTWWVDNPKTDDAGELRAVVIPGKVRYWVTIPDGYTADEEVRSGQLLELPARGTVTAEFRLRKQ